MTSSANNTPEQLLDQVSWIRELADHLVADESARDDLVQDTWLLALERPPQDASRLRQWMATVMRNLVRQRARGEGRRRQREEASARNEELEPTSGLVQRATMQRELVQSVLDMDEPYRSTLLLRYFEEVSPRDIARRLEIPVATVHSRLKRGLAQLRERLDQAYDGNRQAWLALFIPLADAGRLSPCASTIGALILNTKLTLALVTVVVVGTAWTIVSLPDQEAAPPSVHDEPVELASDATSSKLQPSTVFGIEAQAAKREAIEPTSAAPVASPKQVEAAPVATASMVKGQVLDGTGFPLAGIRVRIEGRNEFTTSGPDGRFKMESNQKECRLLAASPEWVTVREGFHRAGSFDPVLVVGPAADLAGEVIAEDGQTLANAKIAFDLPLGFDTRFEKILDSTRRKSWFAYTDGDGKFELNDVPGIEGSVLTVVLDGYARQTGEAPTSTDRGLMFILKRPTVPVEGALSGRVVDPAGEPVKGARVATGLASTITDKQGLFHLGLHRAVTPLEVAAVKLGYSPATMERPFSADSENGGWPDFVELKLGGPPLTLRGRAVSEDGEPVEGARVWLSDTRRFGTIGLMPTSFENLMGGARVPPETIMSEAVLPNQDGSSVWSNTSSGGPSTAAWYWKLTDQNGEFEFGGLLDRSYRVNVLNLDTLDEYQSDYFHPDDGLARIEVPASPVYEEVRGVVLDNRNQPVPGVRVTLRRDPYDESSRVFGGSTRVVMTVNRETITTDEQGHFTFVDVPQNGIRFILLSDEIVPSTELLSQYEANPTSIEIRVDVRCHVSIELDQASLVDNFRFRDALGGHLSVHMISEGSHSSSTTGEIIDGRSGVVSVSGQAKQIVLYQGDDLIEVIDVDLWPGEVNVVRSNR